MVRVSGKFPSIFRINAFVFARSQFAHFISSAFFSWFMSAGVFLLALVCNLYQLGRPSVWFDEAFSVELAQQPLPHLLHIIFHIEPNMELYYLFLHFWLRFIALCGWAPTEFMVRFPSAIFAACATLGIFVLGWRFLGKFPGSIAALLYLLNDLQLVYAQQVRSYTLQLLFISLAWYVLLIVLLREKVASRYWWIGYVVTMTLAIYAHLFSVFILLAQILTFVGLFVLPGPWRVRVRQQVLPLLLCLIAIIVLGIPLWLVGLQGSKTSWLPAPHINDLYRFVATVSGASRIYTCILAVSVLAGFLFLLLSYRIVHTAYGTSPVLKMYAIKKVKKYPYSIPVAWALLCWLCVPVALSYIISYSPLHLFSSRYLVTILPALFLLVALGVSMLPWRVLQLLLASGLVIFALLAVPLYYQSAQVEDWNVISHWLLQQYEPQDGLVCYDNELMQGCQISVEYYLQAYPGLAHFTADSPGAFSWTTYGPADPKAGFIAALDPDALAAYGAQHRRVFFIVGRVPNDQAAAHVRSTELWLNTRYHLLQKVVTRTVTISLYETEP